MDFISFDIETTGTLSHQDLIVEIAAIRFEKGRPCDTYQNLVGIDIPMPEQATAVNGITDEMLKGCPSIEKILPEFAVFCENHLMVAHNAVFDVQFLAREIKKNQTPAPGGAVLDTYILSRKVFPRMANYKLSTLCECLKIEGDGFHRAKADALACGKLFLQILNRLPDKGLTDIISFSGKQPLKFPQTFQEGQLSLF